VNVQVDEPWGNDQTARIKLLVRAATDFIRQGNFGNAAIAQQNVHGRIDLRRRVDHVPAFNQQARALSSLVLGTQHSALSIQSLQIVS
jgi:hypothetical protein